MSENETGNENRAELAEPKPGFTLKSFDDIPNKAPDFGLDEIHEARFGSGTMELTQVGMAHMRVKPGMREPFGHFHELPEEVYVVLDGAGKVKLDDEVLDLKKDDVLRVAPEVVRAFEAGPDGLEYVVFSQHVAKDGGLEKDWWQD